MISEYILCLIKHVSSKYIKACYITIYLKDTFYNLRKCILGKNVPTDLRLMIRKESLAEGKADDTKGHLRWVDNFVNEYKVVLDYIL